MSDLLAVRVVDRDGFVVRTLDGPPPGPGANRFTWDGRDDAGEIVADEAYSFHVTAEHNGVTDVAFAARETAGAHATDVKPEYFDRTRGVLSYKLPQASRVHIQAGTAKPDSLGRPQGAAVVNIVDREPRPAGAIVEHWSGFDSTGTIYVPDLAHFVLAMVASPLPSDAVILVGNKKRTFASQAQKRRGTPLLPRIKPSHHHSHLDALADRAPLMALRLSNAEWKDNRWEARRPSGLVAVLEVNGVGEHEFTSQPRRLEIFLNGDLVSTTRPSGRSAAIQLPDLAPGDHLVTVNWASDFGPVATSSARVHVFAAALIHNR